MARKFDTGSEPPIHTAIQAMIGRAHITANRDHKRVGIVCDLANEQLVMVDMGHGRSQAAEFFRIIEPGSTARVIMIRERDSVPADASIGLEEPQYC